MVTGDGGQTSPGARGGCWDLAQGTEVNEFVYKTWSPHSWDTRDLDERRKLVWSDLVTDPTGHGVED